LNSEKGRFFGKKKKKKEGWLGVALNTSLTRQVEGTWWKRKGQLQGGDEKGTTIKRIKILHTPKLAKVSLKLQLIRREGKRRGGKKKLHQTKKNSQTLGSTRMQR